MMKINLSGDKDENQSEQTIASASPLADASTDNDFSEESVVEVIEPTSKKRSVLFLILLVIVGIGAAVYYNKDLIMSFFPHEAQVIQPPVAPPPPPQPEPEVVKAEPDPTFVTLREIGELVPPRIWLTAAVIKYDGTYQIKGMAFSHKSMVDMVAQLQDRGTVTSQSIPGEIKSAESIYRFGIDGSLKNLKVPEILDSIPSDDLAASAEIIRSREQDLGIKFSSLPKSGATYTDDDMPFSLDGSYEGLKNVIGMLCPEDGTTRVFKITISPSKPGRTFDRVKASFSLKMVSSI